LNVEKELNILNKNLLILGAGGHGRVVKETAEAMGCFNNIDFLDDNSELAIGKCEEFKKYSNYYSYGFVGIGKNEQRIRWIAQLIDAGYQLPVLIHPTAYISPSAVIETGTIVCPKAVINNNAKVKKGCIISIGALVDHDSCIGEGSHVNSGAIVKASCTIEPLKKLDAGMVYSNEKKIRTISL
jgi:sugar O-acyltransferase (sialic acid O-acetyltransferase NeuD family)